MKCNCGDPKCKKYYYAKPNGTLVSKNRETCGLFKETVEKLKYCK